jgi:hypothetical protein
MSNEFTIIFNCYKWITIRGFNGFGRIVRSMPQNRKKPPAIGRPRRKPLDKTMLLPHPAAYVREQSLRRHLALAAFRAGKGNGDLLAELVKVLYLT